MARVPCHHRATLDPLPCSDTLHRPTYPGSVGNPEPAKQPRRCCSKGEGIMQCQRSVATSAKLQLSAAPRAHPGTRGRHVAHTSSSLAAWTLENSRNTANKRAENTPGPFWVDKRCIDCDTCRWMTPGSFSREGTQSAVVRQPETHEERVRALQALLSCPTSSIHCDNRTADELHEAQRGLPAPVPGIPGVYHCGWHSENSFGCAAYLVLRPEGNILVESPRYNPVLAKRLEEMGGVKYIFLSHKDDAGDHALWQKHFNAVRVMHQGEVDDNIGPIEVQLEGEGPWRWSDVLTHPLNHHTAGKDQILDGVKDDIELIFTPGHTTHHVCMHYESVHTLFAGDHIAGTPMDGASEQLIVFKDFCWYNFDIQLTSVVKLLDCDFLHVLPGHGRQAHFTDSKARVKALNGILVQHGYIAHKLA